MIVKKDGSIIQAKVSEIGTSEVKYTKWSNQDGPSYAIAKSDILAITYQNGEKETFGETTGISTNEPQYVEKQPDANNTNIINLYPAYQSINLKPTSSLAKVGMTVFSASSKSVFSNDDVEMYMEVNPTYLDNFKFYPLFWYRIKIKNKTDRTIYIDKAQCFRCSSAGETHRYYVGPTGYNPKADKTIERYVIIPAGKELQLTRNVFSYDWVENVEDFSINVNTYKGWVCTENYKYQNTISRLFRMDYGSIHVGEEKKYSEDESPFLISYYITYSFSEDYNQYSMLSPTFYLSKVIGLEKKTWFKQRSSVSITKTNRWFSSDKKSYPSSYLNGYNDKTLIGCIGFTPNVANDQNTINTLNAANKEYENGNYSKAAGLFEKVLDDNYPLSGELIYKYTESCYNSNSYKALQIATWCYDFDDISDIQKAELPKMIVTMDGVLQDRNARLDAIGNAVAGVLSQLPSQINNIVNARNSSIPQILPNVNNLKRKTSSVSSNSDDDDDEKEKDIDIKDIKIKCHECGGSGKCRQSGVVDARTTRCGGSGKCPMCNGNGRTHTKCPKCKGDGCPKCDDTGYTKCTGCDGSGECDHCGGSGKCPRCNGTGKE